MFSELSSIDHRHSSISRSHAKRVSTHAPIRPSALPTTASSPIKSKRAVKVIEGVKTTGTPVERVRKATNLEHFQYRIGCLATYYVAMLLTGQLDEEWFPKEGAPTFCGHPDEERNVFRGDPKKFLITLKAKLKPHLNPITRHLIDEIHSKGMKGLFRISSQIVKDIDKLIYQMTHSKDPAKMNAKILKLILSVISPIFKRYEESYTPSRHLTPPSVRVEIPTEEMRILEEKTLAEVVDSTKHTPQKYLEEALKQSETTAKILDLTEEKTKGAVRTFLSRTLKSDFSDYPIPDTWTELKMALDKTCGKDSQNLIYTIQKKLFERSVTSERSRNRIWACQIQLVFSHVSRGDASRIAELNTAYEKRKQDSIHRQEDYRNSLRDDLISNHKEAKKLLKERGYKDLEDAKQKIRLKTVQKYRQLYPCSTEKELFDSFRTEAKKLYPHDDLMQETDYRGRVEEFTNQVEADVTHLQEQLHGQTKNKIYTRMTSAIRDKFLGIAIQFTRSPKERTAKVHKFFDAKNSLAASALGRLLGIFVFLWFFLFGNLYNYFANKATQHIMANHLPIIVQQIFGSIENMFLQNEGLKGMIFSCLNGFAESFNPSQTALSTCGTDSTAPTPSKKEAPVTEEELKQAKALINIILNLLKKIHGLDEIKIGSFNLSTYLTQKTINGLAHKLALFTRQTLSDKRQMNQLKETAISCLPGIFDQWDAPIIANDYIRQEARKEEEKFFRETKPKLIQSLIRAGSVHCIGETATDFMASAIAPISSAVQRAIAPVTTLASTVADVTGVSSLYQSALGRVVPAAAAHSPIQSLDKMIQSFVSSTISAFTNPYGEQAILYRTVSLYTRHLEKTTNSYQKRMPHRRKTLRSYEHRAKVFLPSTK